MQSRWFNTNCSKGKNHLAAYAPGEHFEDNLEYVDVAIRNKKDEEDPIALDRMELIDFLKQINSVNVQSKESGHYSLSCKCEVSDCAKKLVVNYHDKYHVKLHIENSSQPEAIILKKDELSAFWEKFKK